MRKAQSLLAAGARLVVVADQIDEMFEASCRSPNIELIRARYSKEYLAEAILAVAATNNSQLNRQIYKDCQELEVLCNVVDDPECCDFFVPALVKHGNLQIAICTGGDYPAYAAHIKKKLEKIFTDKHGRFLAELQALRRRIIADIPDEVGRKALLGQLADDESFEYFLEHGPIEWRNYTEKIIKGYDSPPQ